MPRETRRRRLVWAVIVLGLLEAGAFLVAGLVLGDTPLAALAPVVVLGGALAAWRQPLLVAVLLVLFACLIAPMVVAVGSGEQEMSARVYASVVTITLVPVVAACLLLLSRHVDA